jgi:hypothetical protein
MSGAGTEVTHSDTYIIYMYVFAAKKLFDDLRNLDISAVFTGGVGKRFAS